MADDQLKEPKSERMLELIRVNEQLQAELADSRRTEQALRLSDQRLRLAVHASRTGLWDWDVETDDVYFSPEWKAQIGYGDQEIENRVGEWEQRVHPDDHDRVFASVEAYLAKPWSTFEVEYRLRHKDGSYRWILSRATMFTDSEGKPQRMLGSHVDITDRKRVEQGLLLLQSITMSISEAEDLESALPEVLRKVCEATGWALGQAWTPNLDTTVLECSSSWHGSGDLDAFRGCSQGLTFSPGVGLPGRVWASKRPVWVRDVTVDLNFPRAESARQVGLKGAVGIPALAGDEVVLVMEFFVRQLREEDESLIDLISAVAAELGLVIQRKRSEEALRRKEFEYRSLVESVHSIVWRGDARTFQFSFVSKEAETLLGYPAEQWISDSTFWVNHIHPDDREWAVSYCMKATDEQRDHEFEYRMIAEDGRVVWLRDIVRVVVENGITKELVGVMIDVTERKTAEAARRQSDTKFLTIFETIPDAVMILRLRDWMVLDVNDAWVQESGYPKARRIGTTHESLDLMVDPDARKNIVQTLLDTGEIHNLEGVYRIKDGSLRYGLMSAKRIELDGEQCAVAIVKNITDYKAATEAVRQSETKFRTLAETTPSAIVVYRFEDGRIRYVNAAMEKITGFSQEELVASTIWDIIHPDFVKIVNERRLARRRGETVSPRLELKLLTKNGQDRWVDQSMGRIEFEGQSAMIVTAFDITDRKNAEEALRRSEERYRLIVENQTEFIVKSLPDGTRTFVNDSYCRYFGMSEEECLGTSFFPLVAPEFREVLQQKTLSLTPEEPAYTEEHLSIVPGEPRWQQWTTRGIFDDDGKLIELLSSGRDITERKTAEEALQESEARARRLNERFSLAVDSAGIGVWDLDLLSNELTWDTQMCRLYEIEPEYFGGGYEEWMSRVHPEDQARAHREAQQAIKGLKPFDTDFRIVWATGEFRHIKAFARVVRDECGTPIRMAGINYDITDRKQAEEQVNRSRELLRALSAHLQSVREEERTRISREIHDELGQALTGLKMDLSYLQRTLLKKGARDLDKLTEKASSMSKLVDATIHTVRKIATDLRPGILDDLGLVAAIEWQAQDFQKRTGITCRFAPDIEDLELDRDRSTASFRIFQETLTNVARHSGASEVAVSLNRRDDSVALEIRDNGKGISDEEISGSRSLGLLGMRERAHLLGGELKITGAPGEGTTVMVRIPLS